MGKGKEQAGPETLEEELREVRRSILNLLELFLPPKEVREEVVKNLYTMELALLRIFKTIIDYQVEELQSRIEKKEGRKKAKKIEVE